MNPLPVCLLLLLSAPLTAQLAGGEWDLLRQDLGPDAGGRAGESVAACGDLNGDGVGDLIIGMPFASPGGLAAAGAARVLSGADGSELYRFDGTIAGGLAGVSVATGALLYQIDGPNPAGKWGITVAFLGDLNGDARSEFIAGAFQASAGGLYQNGRAIVMDGATGGLLFNLIGDKVHAEFGFAAASAGDINGDGTPDFMVGAPTDNTPIHHAGKIFVYSGVDASVIHELHGLWDSGHMGGRLANAGDVNGDGTPDIIGGAVAASMNGNVKAGAVRVWSGLDGSLMYQITGTHGGQQLGECVAAAGDLNQDGFDDFAICGPQSDANGLSLSGSLFLHSGLDGSLLAQFDGAAAGDEFASWVDFGDDYDGDGRPDFLIGVPGDDSASADAGGSQLLSYDPYLDFGPLRLSAAAGGSLQWDIDFPLSEAGLNYVVLLSRSGTGPSSFHGLEVPLTQDSLFQSVSTGSFPSGFVGAVGVLDANGDGSASYSAAAGAMANFVGRRFWSAAISYVPNTATSLSSASAMLEITP